jgi:hypothetical protein
VNVTVGVIVAVAIDVGSGVVVGVSVLLIAIVVGVEGAKPQANSNWLNAIVIIKIQVGD